MSEAATKDGPVEGDTAIQTRTSSSRKWIGNFRALRPDSRAWRLVRGMTAAASKSARTIFASFANQDHHGWALAALVVGCIWLYGGFILRTYAGGDFAPAVSYALNFKIALDHGQLPPRLVEFPREFQLGAGTVDGTPPTPDAPVFQYYAFLPSALAYPWLSLGIKGPEALGCVILSCFIFGAICLYLAALLLGARRNLAVLAAWSYLVSPWLISNIYGRGGVAEGLSHALLPLLGLGVGCAWTGRYRAAIVATALGIGGLALAHNIFLLHGALFLGLIIACGGIGAILTMRSDRTAKLVGHLAGPASLALGFGLGLAISSWQWIPAYLALPDISFVADVTDSFVQDFSDLSGAFGMPRNFALLGSVTPYFFTIGWWTVPSILIAVCFARAGRRQPALILMATFAVYFLLTFLPKLAYPLLPQVFTATQMSFRTLAFLSLAGAMAVMLMRWNPGWKTTLSLLAIMTASQITVLRDPVPLFRFTDDQYLKGWEVNAFHSHPNFLSEVFRVPMAGGLVADNKILTSRWRVATGSQGSPLNLRLIGRPIEGMDKPFSVWASASADVSTGNVSKAYGVATIAADRFDITLAIPQADQNLRIFFSKSLPVSIYRIAFKLDRAYLIESPLASYVYSDAVIRTEALGLRRSFNVRPESVKDFQPSPSGGYVIEIPMVYSRFLVARQGGDPLRSWVDFNYRLNVRAPNLAQPIIVTYEIPGQIWWLTAAGLELLALVTVFGGALSRKPGVDADQNALSLFATDFHHTA